MKPIDKLTEEEAGQLALMFEIAPRLADAYRLKNEFLTVIRSKSSAEGKKKLADWLLAVEVMDLPEFNDCTKAYHNWFSEILNSMDVPCEITVRYLPYIPRDAPQKKYRRGWGSA